MGCTETTTTSENENDGSSLSNAMRVDGGVAGEGLARALGRASKLPSFRHDIDGELLAWALHSWRCL